MIVCSQVDWGGGGGVDNDSMLSSQLGGLVMSYILLLVKLISVWLHIIMHNLRRI